MLTVNIWDAGIVMPTFRVVYYLCWHKMFGNANRDSKQYITFGLLLSLHTTTWCCTMWHSWNYPVVRVQWNNAVVMENLRAEYVKALRRYSKLSAPNFRHIITIYLTVCAATWPLKVNKVRLPSSTNDLSQKGSNPGHSIRSYPSVLNRLSSLSSWFL